MQPVHRQTDIRHKNKQTTHLMVYDRHTPVGRQWDGGHSLDKVSHLNTTLHLPVTREGPQDGVHQIPGHVLLQLIKLHRSKESKIMENFPRYM